ncbi:MAG: hypothetical protein KatS3mg122_1211 [Caldimonas sp.]|uniref:hypothetical protein n=1 Tax=Caldimonas taiwanensis TaxID=307483 RepID=UPI00078054CE|nr:hypothetical protein [Caldimonas taiwanensis]GIX23980.1 MAG: hypothetical protein KatS3mg122_1211 [Caldimonas sp.]
MRTLGWITLGTLAAALLLEPWAVVSGLMLGLLLPRQRRPAMRAPRPTPGQATVPSTRTADGRFAALHEDWVGPRVLSIDAPQVPGSIRRHAARLRPPAHQVIDLGDGSYLLYGAQGQWLDACHLRVR